MKLGTMLFNFLFMGCGQTKESINIVDSSVPDVVDIPQDLYGTQPQQDTPPPVFSALNYNDEVRTQEDLIGHPTVIWFFPFAGTPG